MKYCTFAVLVVLLFTGIGSAQSIGIFGGLTNSAFSDQVESANGFEAGATFLLDALPILEAGVEYSASVSPFELKSAKTILIPEYTAKYKQSMFGAFLKYKISLPALTPFLRVGAGYYSGSVETDLPLASKPLVNLDSDYKSVLGFNLGAGIDTFIGLNVEFIYHLIYRELDVTEATSAGANYWGLRVGYYYSLL